MTGLDFSAPALAEARRLAARGRRRRRLRRSPTSTRAADVLAGGAFDLVYTGIGALIWLPDIDRWAGVVAGAARARAAGCSSARATRSCARLADPLPDGLLALEHPYFERAEPTVWDDRGTYVAHRRRRSSTHRTIEWNHGLGEIVTALLDHGLDAHDARRARQRPVGRPPRPHGRDRRRRVAPARPPGAPPALVHARRRQAATLTHGDVGVARLERLCHGEHTSVTTAEGTRPMAFSLPELPYDTTALGAVPLGRDVRVPLRQAPQGLRRHAQRHARARRGEGLAGGDHPQLGGQEVQPGRPDLEPQPLLGVDGARWWRGPDRCRRRRHQRGVRLLRQVQGASSRRRPPASSAPAGRGSRSTAASSPSPRRATPTCR